MPKSPPRAAIDEVLARAVTPELKALGFRKRGLVWSLEDDRRRLVFTVEASTFNDAGGGNWRPSYTWVFPGSGRDGRDVAGSVYLGGGAFRWLWLARPRPDIPALETQIDHDWTRILRPLVDASDAPAALIDRSLDVTPRSGLSSLVGSAMALGDAARIHRTLDALLAWMGDEPGRDGLRKLWGFIDVIPQDLDDGSRHRLSAVLDRLPEPEPGDMARAWWRPVAVAVGRLDESAP